MGKLIEGAERIRRATGACVLLVHHVGKDGMMRGSSALVGAVTTQLRLSRKKKSGIVTLSPEKMKDAAERDAINLRIHVVELPLGRTSLVLDKGALAALEEEAAEHSRLVTNVLAVLRDTFHAEGATAVEWAAACKEQHNVSRSSFYRARTELTESGQVVQETKGRGSRYRALSR